MWFFCTYAGHRVRLTFPRINRGWGLAQVVMVVDTVVLADERGLPAVATHEPGLLQEGGL